MQTNSQKFENVRTTILSLLLARKKGSTLRQLDNDYCEVEGACIPWKDFGYVSLLNFLQSMSRNIRIERENNTIILKGIATDKSKHVSKLVAGQKSQTHVVGRKLFKPSHYYPKTSPPKFHIPADILLRIIDLINDHPAGINKDHILQAVQSLMPYANIQMQDMEEQFRELSHKIFLTNHKVYPKNCLKKTNGMSSSNCKTYDEQKQTSPIVTVGGEEDSDDLLDGHDDDEDDFRFTPHSYNESATNIKPTSNFIKETVSKYQNQITESTSNVQCEHNNSHYLHDHNLNNAVQSHIECNNNATEERRNSLDGKNGEILINDRIKFRLEKLIQNRPNGIWCAELPEVYLEEYKVSLNYTELGFNSVREFASQLPEIFHCVQPHGTGDFMLYYAKMEIPTDKIKETYKTNILAQLHQIYEPREQEALPVTVSLDICKELIPDDTMNIGECVGYLNVLDLTQNEKLYTEVLVVEVFTPSFFWIQLRKNQRTFKKFMNELHNFYVMKGDQYIVPPLVLEKGLNCACTYNGIWHRGIIKTVKPDLQVTVMFYDYGTLKTCPPDAIHYLHRMFSYLPAQAIPCGLVNTRPYQAAKWTRSATHHFAMRTQMPLIATIASVNTEDNSMMVTLTDTTEEEDVHINDWLVEQKLAEHGKMVCTKYRNFSFRYYLECQESFKKKTEIFKSFKKDKATQCDYILSEKYSQNKVLLDDTNVKVKSASKNSNNQADISEVDLAPSKEIKKKLEFLKSCSILQNNVPIRDHILNFRDKSPRKLKSLYTKLLNFKQISHSNKINDNNNNNNTNNSDDNKQLDKVSLNKSVEQKLHKESPELDTSAVFNFNNNNNNNNDNNNKINKISSKKYDILDKFSNIPKAYAYHFYIHDSEDELDLNCIKRIDKCIEQNEESYIDWSAVHKSTPQKVEDVSHENVVKTTHELVSKTKDKMPLPESCFLKAVHNSSYFAANDKDICWSPNGNINKIHDIPPVLLKNIKKCITNEPESITVALSKKILETLTENKLSMESLELLTSVPRNMNEVQSDSSLNEISSVNSDNKVAHIKNSEHNLENQKENHYCFMKVLPFKNKLLEKLSAMQNISDNSSNLDSDDLSDSKNSTSLWQNIDNSNVNLDSKNSSIDLSSEIDTKDFSDPIKTENTNLDIKKSELKSTVNEYELHETRTLVKETVSLETSVSENNTESTEEIISDESLLSDALPLNIKKIKELEQTKKLLSNKEIIPIELKEVVKESSEIINEVSNVPVFNDIDIESDENEWDVHVAPTELRDILKNQFGFNIENYLNYKSDSSLKITEINDRNSIEYVDSVESYPNTEDDNNEIMNSDKISDSEQCSSPELDSLMNQSKKSKDRTSTICSEKNSNTNDKNVPNLTHTVPNSGKIQGKSKTLVEMLNKAKLLQKGYMLS